MHQTVPPLQTPHQHLPYSAESKHQLPWDCTLQDCEYLPSSPPQRGTAKPLSIFPSTISLEQVQENRLRWLSYHKATRRGYLPFKLCCPLPSLPSLHDHGTWSITCQWHHGETLRSHCLPDFTPLMSQSGWTRGLGWRGGNNNHQKLQGCLTWVSLNTHRLQKWGPGGYWGFCASQLLVTRTYPNIGVSHQLNN